jgi:Ni/Co efflux regulator RcnB
MKLVLITAAAAFALAVPVAAAAKDNPGKGHKAHPAAARAGTPPGLAKKPYGMPPGQAKKMWSQGERLPPIYITERYYVVDPFRYDLPPAPYGYRWMRIGDQFYLAQTETGLISQVISALVR